jgi:nicotinamidase-related amidase
MPSTALFVIDIQNLMCGDPSTEVPNASNFKPTITTILERARTSISTARAAGEDPNLTIVFVQHEETEDADGLIKGTERWELYFKPDPNSPDERVVAKTTRTRFV